MASPSAVSATSSSTTGFTRGLLGNGRVTACFVADDKPEGSDPLETGLRRRLRVISGCTFLGLLVLLVLADTFGQSSGLHASEFIFGSLLGALLLVIGVEGGLRWLGK